MRAFRFIAVAIATVLALAACGTDTSPGAAPQAPAAAPVAAQPVAAPVAKTLIVHLDTVRGPEGLTDEQKTYLSCVQQNRFPQGSEIVWRVRVTDPATGKPMDEAALKSVVLTLPDGKTQELKYGPHPKNNPVDYFWTTSFKIAASYPTGAFSYKLEATDKEGRTGTYSEFKVALAMLQIVPAGKQ